MKRIIHNNSVFTELNENFFSGNEADFENLVQKYLPAYFYPSDQEIKVGKLKLTFVSSYGTVEPDLIAFDKAMRNWWVIEVETSNHRFKQHVLDQMQRISDANYSIRAEDISEYVQKKMKIAKKYDYTKCKFIKHL